MSLDLPALVATLQRLRDGLRVVDVDGLTRVPVLIPDERVGYALLLRGEVVSPPGAAVEYGPPEYERMAVTAARTLARRRTELSGAAVAALHLSRAGTDLATLRTLARQDRRRLDALPVWPRTRDEFLEIGEKAGVSRERSVALAERIGSSSLSSVADDYATTLELYWRRLSRHQTSLLASRLGARLAELAADTGRSRRLTGTASPDRVAQRAGQAAGEAWRREKALCRALARQNADQARAAAQSLTQTLEDYGRPLVDEAVLLKRLPLAQRTDGTNAAVQRLGDVIRALLRAHAVGLVAEAAVLGGPGNPAFGQWTRRAANLTVRAPLQRSGLRPAQLAARRRRDGTETTVEGVVARIATIAQGSTNQDPKLTDVCEIRDQTGAATTIVSPYFSLLAAGAGSGYPIRATGVWSERVKWLHLRETAANRDRLAAFPDSGVAIGRLKLTSAARTDWWSWATVAARDVFDTAPNSLALDYGWTADGVGNLLRNGSWSPLA
ncbi:hypothetical protein [Streptomyces phaeochromogenes]